MLHLYPGWDRCSFARWGSDSHPTFCSDGVHVPCSSSSPGQKTPRYFDLNYCRPMSSNSGFLPISFSTDKSTLLLLDAYQIGIFLVAQTDRYYIPMLYFNWLFIGKKQ